jgi:beta-fructofuranosidase
MLRLDDYWIWDSWIADAGEEYHLFFLQAPRALVDPSRRHTAATIGHATSKDLVTWTYHGLALGPAETGWDDLAVWTGSVARGDDGLWRLFYSALSTAGHGIFDQRIGVAESDDLYTWHRARRQPLIEADPTWYQTFGIEGNPASETWRDPFVFRDPGGDGWHMLITARLKSAPRLDDGVLAHARSPDLENWELGPPLTEPAGFGQLEVPQVRVIDGTPLLVFTCHPEEQTEERKRTSGQYCTWSVSGESMTGPWDIGRAQPFRDEPELFAAPLVQDRDGGWVLLGFRNREPQGKFEILDPIPVIRRGDALVRRAAHR